ncbi:hypothetical protein PTKIN_Ptkin15bG0098900 [Pterospermum kingtungense]
MESTTASAASKKRKISHDDDEDDEEEKMEKFYALIKSIREARDHLIMNNISSSAEVHNKEAADHLMSKTKKQKLEDQEKKVLVWKPSFQRGDFMEEADQLKKPPVMSFPSTSSQSKEGTDNNKEQDVKEELDLSLSL